MTETRHRLIEMVNQIAQNFEYETDSQVVAEQVAMHINKFWDPRMRKELQSLAASCSDELFMPVRAAISKIKTE